VNVTHIIPRSKEDLERRRRAFEIVAAATAGMMGRTPDYLNVTFACFAGRADVWARRGNEQGAANLVAYQKHQAFTRAYVKLLFAFGLGHLIGTATGVTRFDHVREKLGQIWNLVELTRSGIVAAEAGSAPDEAGVWCPDERPFLALRGEMPKWMPKANELLQLVGGGGFMCTPSEADVKGPMADVVAKYFQAAGADAERRIRLFRLAWDFLGSDLGRRGELYERFYLSDSFRMTGVAYNLADKTEAVELVEQFLRD